MKTERVLFVFTGTLVMVSIVTIVLLLVFIKNADELEETFVETTLGKINGSIFRTRLDKEFVGFRGIRYAKAPVADLRFRVRLSFV